MTGGVSVEGSVMRVRTAPREMCLGLVRVLHLAGPVTMGRTQPGV